MKTCLYETSCTVCRVHSSGCVAERKWREEVVEEGKREEDREEKGSGNETIHRAGVIVPAAAPQNKCSKSY